MAELEALGNKVLLLHIMVLFSFHVLAFIHYKMLLKSIFVKYVACSFILICSSYAHTHTHTVFFTESKAKTIRNF